MKRIIALLTIFVFTYVMIDCSDKTDKKTKQTTKESQTIKTNESSKTIEVINKPSDEKSMNTALINDFLQDVNTLKNIDKPIKKFIVDADKSAAKKLVFNADNIKEVLSTAKDYKAVIFVVDKHTIVKITDLDKCVASGSWKTCMPFAKGFIKRKSKLVYKEDYSNNIIGIPDTQQRVAYFFN